MKKMKKMKKLSCHYHCFVTVPGSVEGDNDGISGAENIAIKKLIAIIKSAIDIKVINNLGFEYLVVATEEETNKDREEIIDEVELEIELED